MSDLSDAYTSIQTQIAQAAANGGVSSYTQGDLTVSLRDPLKDLDLFERLEERLNRTSRVSRLTQGEVVDPA